MIPELELERREDLDFWGNPPKLNKFDDERKVKNEYRNKK